MKRTNHHSFVHHTPKPGGQDYPMRHTRLLLLPLIALAACEPVEGTRFPTLPLPSATAGQAAVRVDGDAGSPNAAPPAQISLAPAPNVRLRDQSRAEGGGDISLNFADTDIREVVSQILGTTLGKTYTIDPAVKGTATLRTADPLTREQALAALQTLLAQNGASLVQSGGIYRVLPTAAAALAPGFASGEGGAGTTLRPLKYAGAEDLAKTLQPFVQNGGRIAADAGRNALIISGDPSTQQVLSGLIDAFDIDTLAGQSYALLPVPNGDSKDFASAMQDGLRGAGGSLSSIVRVVPMSRISSVLVVSSQPRYIEEARRVYNLVERKRRLTVRSWHVYYLQNSRSNDTAYVLQQAFTPNNVTAQPSAPAGSTQSGIAAQQIGGANRNGVGGSVGGNGISGGGLGGSSGVGGGGLGGGGGLSGGTLGASTPGLGQTGTATVPATPQGANPLLGGLDASGGAGGAGAEQNPDAMRIIPNAQNNALLVYATPQENDTVQTMLRKLDILPLQVRIDATIAEVTLNDTLNYGTQFFFKAGIQGALSFANPASAVAGAFQGFSNGFPGFVLSGPNSTSAALSLLQSVTKVQVLSSPQLLVLDNEAARLQVGALVPYLSQTSQSTITTGSPVINSINYQQTGVIMQVTPRVNSGGLVTLDIAQEVSDVASAVTTAGVNSPTFNERSVTSRVVVQDGQTVGLAGLIRDTDSKQNEGIPWLKDIPLLGALASQQNNSRARTELLILITPHVIHDQRDARSLTEDLRDTLSGAAGVQQRLNQLLPSGSADPQQTVRIKAGLQR